jgi:ElaB/YqjD/DUF883 family membrane-anchored ribosome-binding protein
MDRNTMQNGVDEAVSRARETANGVLNGARSRLDGGARQAADRAEAAYEASLRSIEDAARDRPLPALALALGLGFIVGLLALRR